MVTLTFPDGSKEEFKKGITGLEIAKRIGARLAKDALAVELNNQTIELDRPIEQNGSFRILTWNDLPGKQALWHTGSHVLAEAVMVLFPSAKPTLGPPIEEGFYYDFEVQKPFSEEDLQKIEQKMKEIVKKNEHLTRKEVSKKDALEKFKNNPFKTEMINEYALEGQTLSVYSQGKFFDLCRGGHVSETGKLKGIKVLKSGASYWRGNEKNPVLQRIYGIAFPEEKMLEEFLKRKEEAEKNSHVSLGKELDLFVVSPLVGKGLILWTPKGAFVRTQLEGFLREVQVKAGYQMVITPHLGRKELYETSGHYPHYKDTMYAPVQIEEEEYFLKPMNCPFHIQIFSSQRRSYRELPMRLGEFGTVYRYEKSGELLGLLRVRGFTQDDAHLFVTPEQLKTEFLGIFEIMVKVLTACGLHDFRVRVGTRDESDKYIGSPEIWEKALSNITGALKEKKIPFSVEEGEAAFYGPKADTIVKDALGREWQLGTVQVDYNLPERFDLSYIGEDDKPHRPIMIHRAPFGSLERFTAILIEHFKGAFPPWLAPNAVRVLPLSDKFNDYAFSIREQLSKQGIASQVDDSNNTLSYKIRQAQLEKAPIVVVVGEREQKEKTVTIRLRNGKQFPNHKIDSFIQKTVEIVRERKLEYSY